MLQTIVLLLCCAIGLQGESGSTIPDTDSVLVDATQFLLTTQEGENKAEWPYEGVYRVQRKGSPTPVIPIGYRVGGTSITGIALLRSPDFVVDVPQKNRERNHALQRAATFVCEAISHPRMSWKNYSGGYDVRGWGYIYAILFLLELQEHDVISDEFRTQVDDALDFYVAGLIAIEIPDWGGWNYSRRRNVNRPCPQAPFMTGPALQALMRAAEVGHDINPKVLERGLDALERSRSETGAVEYTGGDSQASPDTQVPGAVGRMLITDSTLVMGSRGSLQDVRGSLDAFLAHWDRLEERRAQTGTHKPPYGVAPYYFFYAHLYAAQAIELLPSSIRDEYRSRLKQRLMSIRDEDGTWNDRVFPRSASYGTATTIIAMTMPGNYKPIHWDPASDASTTPITNEAPDTEKD